MAQETKARAAGSRHGARRRVEIALFLLPALVTYAVFVLLPVALAIYYSLFHWNGLDPLTDFVGLDNYTRAIRDPVFQHAIIHNGIIVGLSLALQLPLGLAVALLLNRRLRGRSALRLIFFAPYVISEVITAVAWQLLLQPDGAVDRALQAVGLRGLVHSWLADTRLVLYTLFVVITWKYLGFGIVLFLAGLSGIPGELIDAAAVDGAGGFTTVRYITLPLLGPTVRVWAFLSIIGSLQLFDLVWIMTLGGPAGASTTMASYLVDHGFKRYQFGYGSAVAVILFAISFVVALAYQRWVLRRDVEGALTRVVE